jgi:hypothetical protein
MIFASNRFGTILACRRAGRPAALSAHPPTLVGRLPVMPERNVVLANQIETPGDRMPPTELSGELRAAVERWAAQQLDKPTIAEALRRLVEDGLATD